MSSAASGRWVLLHHVVPNTGSELTKRGDHWDFMVQVDDALWTWALDCLPPFEASEFRRLADHRLTYLSYEGTVSGDRGTVSRVASGTYRWLTSPQVNSAEFELTLDWPNPGQIVTFRRGHESYWWVAWSEPSANDSAT